MNIQLDNIGKRYRMDWIFRNLSQTLHAGERWAILGPNGSGKSTLMKVLSGHLTPTKGKVAFTELEKPVAPDHIYTRIAYAAPYIELIEEFTLQEALRFHARLKPLLPGFTPENVYDLLSLPRSGQKEIRFFSSGMKQRLKLILAICSDTPVLLLDEPATNLDVQGIDWYKQLIGEYARQRLVVIASNDPHDAEFCPKHLNILAYKQR